MTPEVEQVLEVLHARIAEEDAQRQTLSKEELEARRPQRMLAIGEEAGRFLNLLIKAAGARHLLELGTSVGYSTIWLAEAARVNGGQVTTIDENAHKTTQAKDYLAQAGLAEVVTFLTGDALETIAAKALERKIGARGLRLITEDLMLDVMYELPSTKKVKEFVVTREMVENKEVFLKLLEKAG